MIINLRGNHASGKSTAVRAVLASFPSTPIYGVLGTRFPEAYRCDTGDKPLYILGPYRDQSHGGADVLTKKGMVSFVGCLEKYRAKGGVVLFESILTSVRFGQPGEWLLKHLDQVAVVILDVSLEDCLVSLHDRQAKSNFSGGEKHIRAQARSFELVQRRLKELGFRMEYASRKTVVPKLLELVAEST